MATSRSTTLSDSSEDLLSPVSAAGSNHAPALNNDWAALRAGGSVSAHESILLRNDSDPDGDALRIVAYSDPSHGTLARAADGTLTYTPTPGFVGSDKFTYTVTDGNGLCSTATVCLDVLPAVFTPPAITQVLDDIGTVQGNVANGGTTDDARPAISGTAEAGNKVEVFDNGVKIGEATADAQGRWTLTPTDALPAGANAFTAVASAADGAHASSAPYNVNFSACGCAPHNQAPVVNDEWASLRAGGSVSAHESILLANDSDPEGGPLSVQGYTQPAHGTLVRAADGTLTYTPKPGFTGVDSFTYTVVDDHGATTLGTVHLNVLPATAAPVITQLIDDVGPVQGNVPDGGTTDDTRPLIKGTAEPGATVRVFDNGAPIGQVTSAADGSWSLPVTTPLANGPHAFTATATAPDGASATTTEPYDCLLVPPSAVGAPTVEITEDANNDGLISRAELQGNIDVKVGLPGSAKVGDTVTVTDQAGNMLGKVLVAADIAAGKVVFANAFLPPAEGAAITVTAKIVDASGTASPTATDTATLDTLAPSAPVATITTDNNNDGKISDAELKAHGGLIDVRVDLPVDAHAGDKLTVTDQAGHQVDKILTPADIAARAVSLPGAFPAPADHAPVLVTATVTDPAGNLSQPGTDSATVNSTAPTPTITLVDDKNNDGTITRPELAGASRVDLRVDLPAGAAAGDLLNVTDNAGNGVNKTLTAADLAAGHVDFDNAFPLPAPGGTIAVVAQLTDAAGNLSAPASDTAIFDGNYPPVAVDDSASVRGFITPLATVLAMNQDSNGVVPAGKTWITADGDAGRAVYGQLSSPLTAGMKVQVTSNDHPGAWVNAVISSDGLHWTAVDNTTHTGNWNYTARVLDAAGNAVSTGAAQAVVFDNTAGAAPTITNFGTAAGDHSIALGSSTTDQTLVVNGTSAGGAAAAGGQIDLYVNGISHAVGSATVQADGSWSVDMTGTTLANGSAAYNFYARETDPAGNTSAWSAKASLSIASPHGVVENWADFGAVTSWTYGAAINAKGTLQTTGGLVNIAWKSSDTYYDGVENAAGTANQAYASLFPGGSADGREANVLMGNTNATLTTTFDKAVVNPNLFIYNMYGTLTITAKDAAGNVVNPVLNVVDNTPDSGSVYPLTTVNGNVVTSNITYGNGVIELAGSYTEIVVRQTGGSSWYGIQLGQKQATGGTVIGADDGSIVPGALPASLSGDNLTAFATQAALDSALHGHLDGGTGIDTFKFAGSNMTLNLTNHSSVPGDDITFNNYEKFDLGAGGHNTLTMSVNDVLNAGQTNAFIANGKTQVMVNGDATDTLSLAHLVANGGDAGNWISVGTQSVAGVVYNVFNHSAIDAQVLVQAGVNVMVPAVGGVAPGVTTFPHVEGNVLGNDSDADGSPLALRVSGVAHGAGVVPGSGVGAVIEGSYGHLTVNADGSYSYLADKSAGLTSVVQDVFYYTNRDANGADSLAPAKLSIQVDPALANVLSVDSAKAAEGADLLFTVATSSSPIATSVTLEVASGTGTAGVDTGNPLQVNFGAGWQNVVGNTVQLAPGTTSFQVKLPTVNDTLIETNETVFLKATSVNGSSASGTGTIVDNDLNGHVTGTEDTPLVLGWNDFNLQNLPGAQPKLVIETLPLDGKLQVNSNGSWLAATVGQEVSKADIDAGKLRFVPDLNESGIDGYNAPGVGNKLNDYATFQYGASDASGTPFSHAVMTVDIAPKADGNQSVSLNVLSHVGNFTIGDMKGPYSSLISFSLSGTASTDGDGSERSIIAFSNVKDSAGTPESVYTSAGVLVAPDAKGTVWLDPTQSYYIQSTTCTYNADYVLYRQEVNSAGVVFDQVASPSTHWTFASPIVLDLNGDGVQTVSTDNGVYFDLDNNGSATKTGWVSHGDGLLVRDLDGNGRIDNGGELFGSGTATAHGKAADGFEALKAIDANHDGVLNAGDAAFRQLQVWQDNNGDGISQAGELHSLGSLGIVALNLAPAQASIAQHGNLVGLVSSYTTADGQSHELADVWFSGNGESKPAEALQAADLLGDVPAHHDVDTLMGGAASTAAAAAPSRDAADPSHEGLVQHHFAIDHTRIDLLKDVHSMN